MKYSRNELKALIKECLVELLAEGLGGSLNESVKRSSPAPVRRGVATTPPQRRHDPMLDRRVTPPLNEAIRAQSGGNPVLADILRDTAETTLKEQLSAESGGRPVAGDATSLKVARSTPEELFGEETMSKWADLAFATPGPRSPS